MSKHKSDIRFEKTEVCATAQHAVEMVHHMDFENVSGFEHLNLIDWNSTCCISRNMEQ